MFTFRKEEEANQLRGCLSWSWFWPCCVAVVWSGKMRVTFPCCFLHSEPSGWLSLHPSLQGVTSWVIGQQCLRTAHLCGSVYQVQANINPVKTSMWDNGRQEMNVQPFVPENHAYFDSNRKKKKKEQPQLHKPGKWHKPSWEMIHNPTIQWISKYWTTRIQHWFKRPQSARFIYIFF